MNRRSQRSRSLDFSDTLLVEKFGTWFRVQVAFYDFLFTSSMTICTHHCNEVIASDFAEAGDAYNRMRAAIEKKYPTMVDAWRAFVTANNIGAP